MNSIFLFLLFAGIVSALLFLSDRPAFRPFFERLPVPLWCYFVPMALSSAGLLPASSPIYAFFGSTLLGACLLLLLVGSNPASIWRAGPAAIGETLLGAAGIIVGAVVAYALLASRLHPEMWKGLGSLTASWTGGSANMVAVKEALQSPEAVFAPCLVVDPLVTYTWMSLMVALKPLQPRWDAWVNARGELLQAAGDSDVSASRPLSLRSIPSGILVALMIVGALVLSSLTLSAGRLIPPIGSVLSTKAWGFLLVTALGILASMTPLSKIETYGASRWGTIFLYLLLCSLGAQAHFQDLLQAPLLLVAALIILTIHTVFLLIGAKLMRLPFFFIAAASQANIGGTASAPIVAGLYQPRLASVGLLLAIFLNMLGTTFGLLAAQLCHLLR